MLDINKNWYQGCQGVIQPDQLNKFEASGKYVAEPKADGIWAAFFAREKNTFFSRESLFINCAKYGLIDPSPTINNLTSGLRLTAILRAMMAWS